MFMPKSSVIFIRPMSRESVISGRDSDEFGLDDTGEGGEGPDHSNEDEEDAYTYAAKVVELASAEQQHQQKDHLRDAVSPPLRSPGRTVTYAQDLLDVSSRESGGSAKTEPSSMDEESLERPEYEAVEEEDGEEPVTTLPMRPSSATAVNESGGSGGLHRSPPSASKRPTSAAVVSRQTISAQSRRSGGAAADGESVGGGGSGGEGSDTGSVVSESIV